MNLLHEMGLFEDVLKEEENKLKEADLEDPNDIPTDIDGNGEPETAFLVMKNLMEKFRDFCEYTEYAWKIQEIPAPLRQRLISLDQLNQERYQKLFMMIQKYAEEMKAKVLKGSNPDENGDTENFLGDL